MQKHASKYEHQGLRSILVTSTYKKTLLQFNPKMLTTKNE